MATYRGRSRSLGVAAIGVLAVCLSGCARVPAGDVHRSEAKSGDYSAVIRRTAYGVPHIQAADFGGLGYGYGFAFAQDNICSLESDVLTAQGSRSVNFGAAADSGDTLNGAVSNLDSDFYYRALNESGVVERLIAQPAPLGPDLDVKQLVTGYVAGINRFLKATGVEHISDPTCRSQPWVRAVSEVDVYRIMYNLSQTGGLDAVKPAIANAKPAVPDAGGLPQVRESQFGSNGIAVGRAGSRNGHGQVLANPHFPWQGNKRFYQVQLTIPGRLNVSGASLYGTPAVEIGHTEHLAWTHTVSTAQRFTLYQLQLVAGDPTSYVVDGAAEPMAARTITVPVKAAGTGPVTVTRTLYSSRYGPLMANNWTSTTALAIKGASATNLRAVNEWLAMGEADSVPELRLTQNRTQGIPFVNTLAADSHGRTYIADATVVPHVTDEMAKRCVSTPIGKALYPTQTVLDGSTSACEWGTDPDAIEAGIFGPAALPTLTRTDFVTNSNDSLWLSNPAEPLTSYPRIFGDVGSARSLRTRLGLEVIDGRVHGTDGQGPPGFTTASLQDAVFADRNYSAALVRDAVVTLCRENPTLIGTDQQSVDTTQACAVLANWDLRAEVNSRGAVLWRQFWLNARKAADLWSVPFDAATPATTPSTLNPASSAVRSALADAIRWLRTVGVALDAPLSQTQITSIGGDSVAVPGCSGEEGCYNVVTGAARIGGLGDDGRFADVAFGSSFIMDVDLGPKGPRGRTLLTYSQSADPTSAHHGDQTALFAQKKLVQDRFTETEILGDPRIQVTRVRS